MEEQDNLGTWYRKSDWRDFYLNFDPDVTPENCTRTKPLDGVEHQRFDEETGEWVVDLEAEKQAQIAALKIQLAAIDQEACAGRNIRDLALRTARAAGITGGEDFTRLQKYEDRALPLRIQVEKLKVGK